MYDQAIISGIDPVRYWELTLAEITAAVEAHNYKTKQAAIDSYNTACMIADFVGRSIVGESIPAINELFSFIEVPENTEADKQAVAFYKDQFMVYAEKYNAQRREKK